MLAPEYLASAELVLKTSGTVLLLNLCLHFCAYSCLWVGYELQLALKFKL